MSFRTLDFSIMESLCESPIEGKFLMAWMEFLHESASHPYGRQFRFYDRQGLDTFTAFPEKQPWGLLHVARFDAVFIQPQIGEYRVDFVLGRVVLDKEDNKQILRRLPMIVVECDGHDFHEKTKEQAQRDKSRDRSLLAQGFRVLRFTGSEIHRDSDSCAAEVNTFFFDCLLRPRSVDAANPRTE